MSYLDLGVLFNNGQVWKEQRRFALRSLRDFGMGKLSMEGRIQDEAEQFVDELKKQSGQKLDMQYLITNAVSNVICNMVFGQRFEYDDPVFLESIQEMNRSLRVSANAFVVDMVPVLRYFPSKMRSDVSRR